MTKKPKPFVGWAIMRPNKTLVHLIFDRQNWGKCNVEIQARDSWANCYKQGYRVIKVKITPLTGGKR